MGLDFGRFGHILGVLDVDIGRLDRFWRFWVQLWAHFIGFGSISGVLGLDLRSFWTYFGGSGSKFGFGPISEILGLDMGHFAPISGVLGLDLDHFGPILVLRLDLGHLGIWV